MKKILLETKFSKLYIIIVVILTLLIVGGYYSYAMFTVNKEKSNAISIVTGTLSYDLSSDGAIGNTLSVNSGETKEFTVTLSNPNNRIARFNFYYIGALPDGVSAGYVTGDGLNTPPLATGVNLEADGSVGASNVYKIKVTNNSGSNITITLGVGVGLDYNDLSLPSNGHLFAEISDPTIAEMLLADSANNINTSDKDQTFITGADPNNYIWYSGKLWRAISVNSDNTVKIITTQKQTMIPYNSDEGINFSGSHAEKWLNDVSNDGFLGTLREREKFIKMDSMWNASSVNDTSASLPTTTLVTNAVGLINVYEYKMTLNKETNYSFINSYAATTNYYNTSYVWYTALRGNLSYTSQIDELNLFPVINIYGDIKVADGNGTESDPYRLEGDNDKDLSGVLLNTRYSGEYINFGLGANNLYRIVNIDADTTKIVSDSCLTKIGSDFHVENFFGDNSIYSANYGVGLFLNNDYLNPDNGYLASDKIAMIVKGKWYVLSEMARGDSYEKATEGTAMQNDNTKVGMPHVGELLTYGDSYWTITPYSQYYVWVPASSSFLSIRKVRLKVKKLLTNNCSKC